MSWRKANALVNALSRRGVQLDLEGNRIRVLQGAVTAKDRDAVDTLRPWILCGIEIGRLLSTLQRTLSVEEMSRIDDLATAGDIANLRLVGLRLKEEASP